MTMIYRRLDANHDPVWGAGRQDFLSAKHACGQAILTRLLLLLGEWWEDRGDGLPLWQQMLGVYGAKKEALDRVVTERILGTPNVERISYMQSSLQQRHYIFSATVETVFGMVQVTNQGVF